MYLEIAAPKIFGKNPENASSRVLQPTTRLKTPLQIVFLKSSDRKECTKISDISKNFLQNCPLFPNAIGLECRSSSFSTHRPITILKTNSKANVSGDCSESF